MNDDKKMTKKAFTETNAACQSMLEHEADSIFIIDPASRRFIDVNEKAAAWLGYTKQELLAMKVDDIYATDQAIMIGAHWDVTAHNDIIIKHIHRRKDGSPMAVEINSRIIDYDGRKAIQNRVRDVTEQTKIEEKMNWEQLVNFALSELSSELINSSRTIPEIATSVLHWSQFITKSDQGFVSSIDPAQGDMIVHSVTSMLSRLALPENKAILFNSELITQSNEFQTHSLITKMPFFTNNPMLSESSKCALGEQAHIYNFLSVPALVGGNLVGQIVLANTDSGYNSKHLTAIIRLAQPYAISVQRLRNELELSQSQEIFKTKVQELTIELEKAKADLAREADDRIKIEEEIQSHQKEKEVLLKEIHHRVKNNMQIITSLLNLQAMQISDDYLSKLFRDNIDRICTIAKIHEKLYKSTNLARINIKDYINELVDDLLKSYNKKDNIIVQINVDDIYLGIPEAIPFGLLINEIIINAMKHAFPAGINGEIMIRFKKNADSNNEIIIADNGIGFPKIIDFNNPITLGLELITVLSHQLKGSITLDSTSGTCYTIIFP